MFREVREPIELREVRALNQMLGLYRFPQQNLSHRLSPSFPLLQKDQVEEVAGLERIVHIEFHLVSLLSVLGGNPLNVEASNVLQALAED